MLLFKGNSENLASNFSSLSSCQEKSYTCHCWLCKMFTHCFQLGKENVPYCNSSFANLKTSTAHLAVSINGHYTMERLSILLQMEIVQLVARVPYAIGNFRDIVSQTLPLSFKALNAFPSWLPSILINSAELLK